MTDLVHRIGKYELRKVLGKGASATVYLALDTFSGENVALKVLDPEVVSDPNFDKTQCTQFLNEASLAGKLLHPHIAAILEASVSDSSGYIAIEYVPGGDLSQFASREHLLPLEDVIEIGYKCCGALDYAFRQGIVHRDLKPANIMVVGGTNIKVADFGAAYLQRSEGTQIADVGSPLYMSPEQITGQPLGHHSDMFSLGVVLYVLLTARRPFVADTLVEIGQKIVFEDPVAPSELRAGLSRQIDHIVMRMLNKAPADRYPDWTDVALELADIGRLSTYAQVIPDSGKFVALRNNTVLERLNDAEIWELVHAGCWTRVPAHKVLMREGDPGDSLFFLACGEAKVTKHDRLLNLLNAGEYFGEMAYVKSGAISRQATVESTTDVLLAEFQTAALHQVSKNCQLQLSRALLDTLVDRLAFADERITRAIS